LRSSRDVQDVQDVDLGPSCPEDGAGDAFITPTKSFGHFSSSDDPAYADDKWSAGHKFRMAFLLWLAL